MKPEAGQAEKGSSKSLQEKAQPLAAQPSKTSTASDKKTKPAASASVSSVAKTSQGSSRLAREKGPTCSESGKESACQLRQQVTNHGDSTTFLIHHQCKESIQHAAEEPKGDVMAN